MLKRVAVFEENGFSDKAMTNFLVHESPYLKIINFNFKAGQQLPVHAHDIDGQVSITVLEGRGEFIGAAGSRLPANPGDVLVADISEPHGIKADSDMRVLVAIAPPI
jgi:quercetin dioxygenase-like cupin family protein